MRNSDYNNISKSSSPSSIWLLSIPFFFFPKRALCFLEKCCSFFEKG